MTSLQPQADKGIRQRDVRLNMELPQGTPKENCEKPRLRDMLTKTEIHGFGDLYEAPNWPMRIFWIVVVVAACVILTWQLYLTVSDFIDNPIITTFKLINQYDGLQFPEVYICPVNGIHRRAHEQAHVDGDWIRQHADVLHKSISNFTGLNGLLAAKVTLKELFASFKRPTDSAGSTAANEEPLDMRRPKTVEQYFKEVGYPIDVFFQECAFDAQPFRCRDHVLEVFDPDYGKCFLIRMKQHQRVRGVGLSLVIDLDTFENSYPEIGSSQPLFDGILLKIAERVSPGTGFAVKVQSATYTTVLLDARKLNLIDRTETLESQFCNDETAASKAMKVFDSRYYDSGTCIEDCVQRLVVAKCQCFLPTDWRFLNKKTVKAHLDVCKPKVMASCVLKILQDDQLQIKNCSKLCYVPCSYWEYRATASSVNFPTHTWNRGVPHNKTNNTRTLTYSHVCGLPPTKPSDEELCGFGAVSVFDLLTDGQKLSSIASNASTMTERTWYWNRVVEDCTQHSFRVCNDTSERLRYQRDYGQKNIFETRTECLNACGYGNPCMAPESFKDRPGFHKTVRYAWDVKEQRCRRYYFHHHLANANNFKTKDECELRCNASTNNPCTQAPPTDTKCEFWSLKQSSDGGAICVPESVAPTAVDTTGCLHMFLSKAECVRTAMQGNPPPCHPMPTSTPLYYHNTRYGRCEVFHSFNCSHSVPLSANRFVSLQDCQQQCIKPIVKPSNWTPSIVYEVETVESQTTQEVVSKERLLTGTMTILDIAFPNLQYVSLSQESSMTFTTFVGNVGGQVGLWVGCSMVSMFKICTVMVPICAYRFQRTKRRKLANQTENHACLENQNHVSIVSIS